jgi:hypothetical protein
VTEREIIEAELREIISLEEYETSSGLGREEYESDVMTWSCAIVAALRESRKAGVEATKIALEAADEIIGEFFAQWGGDYLVRKWGLDQDVASFRSKQKPAALAALSRLAGDE